MIGGDVGLPEHVIKTAAKFLRVAFEEQLPGAWMSWKALAGGAVWYAAQQYRPRPEWGGP